MKHISTPRQGQVCMSLMDTMKVNWPWQENTYACFDPTVHCGALPVAPIISNDHARPFFMQIEFR